MLGPRVLVASRSTRRANVLVVELMGGTLTSRSSTLPGRGVFNEPRRGGWVAQAHCWVLRDRFADRSVAGPAAPLPDEGGGWPGFLASDCRHFRTAGTWCW